MFKSVLRRGTAAATDAAPMLDAGALAVVEVACDSGDSAVTVTAPGFSYTFTPDDGAPAGEYTIAVNAVVRFEMSISHNAISGLPGSPDGRFRANFGETKCFRFDEVGSYAFHCGPHQFSATLIVE